MRPRSLSRNESTGSFSFPTKWYLLRKKPPPQLAHQPGKWNDLIVQSWVDLVVSFVLNILGQNAALTCDMSTTSYSRTNLMFGRSLSFQRSVFAVEGCYLTLVALEDVGGGR